MGTTRQHHSIFQLIKENSCQRRILYSEKKNLKTISDVGILEKNLQQ